MGKKNKLNYKISRRRIIKIRSGSRKIEKTEKFFNRQKLFLLKNGVGKNHNKIDVLKKREVTNYQCQE